MSREILQRPLDAAANAVTGLPTAVAPDGAVRLDQMQAADTVVTAAIATAVAAEAVARAAADALIPAAILGGHAGFSVFGRASTGTGTVADIAVGTSAVVGRSGAGDVVSVAIGGGIEFSGATLQRSALTGDVVASAGSAGTVIQTGVVTNAKRANMAASTLSGNATGSPAAPTDLAVAAVKTLLAFAFSDIPGTLLAAQFPALTGDITTTAGAVATTLSATGVGAGIYGDGSHVAQITVDAKGRITAASSPSISIAAGAVSGLAAIATNGSAASLIAGTIPAARMPALTGDITTVVGAVATTLAITGVGAGSYGSASAVPVFSVDAKGRITTAANVAIAVDASAVISGTLAATRMPALTGAVTTVAGAVATTLAAGVVANANRANMTANTLSGNATGSPAAPTDIGVAAVRTLLGLAAIATSGSAADLTSGTIPSARIPIGAGISIVSSNITNDFSTGKAGGLTVIGGTNAFDILQLRGTTSASLGYVLSVDSFGVGTNPGNGHSPPVFAVGMSGVTVASAAGAVLDYAIFKAQTVAVTGSTNITTATGFNYVSIEPPVYSTTVTIGFVGAAWPAAATLVIKGAPTIAGTGSFTGLVHAVGLWVQGSEGAMIDGRLIAGSLYSTGRIGITIAQKFGWVDSISGTNTDWQSGYEASPVGAVLVTAAAIVHSVYPAAGCGFMIRNSSNTSLFEVQGSDGAVNAQNITALQGHFNGTIFATSGLVASSTFLAGTNSFNYQFACDNGLNTIGFFSRSPLVAKLTVAGSRAGNVAIQQLLNALSAYGLVTDSTTP